MLFQPFSPWIHLWTLAPRNLLSSRWAWKCLDETEKESLTGLTPASQENAAIKRAQIKTILARYNELSPAEVHFHHNRFGKPFFGRYAFSIAHTGQKTILGISNLSALGTDLEDLRKKTEIEHFASRFTEEELHGIASSSEEAYQKALAILWVRKEAVLKAVGVGLHEDLRTIKVSHKQSQPLSYRINREKNIFSQWSTPLFVDGNFLFTLAYPCSSSDPPRMPKITFTRFDPEKIL